MKRTILVVDDEQNMLAVIRMVLEDAGHNVIAEPSAEHALRHLSNPNLDAVLTDLRMPGMGGDALLQQVRKERPDVPVIVITAHGTIKSAVDSIHAGAADYLSKPFEPEALEIAVHNALKLRDILLENAQLKATVSDKLSGKRLIGESPELNRLLEEIQACAPYKSNVLISGESGSGKEVVAHTVHDLSPRREGPWVAINCAAIPRDLLESELFGYVKGAFTGASANRAGRLEQAQGGTLFLDEIGDMDIGLQAKLLRVLQEREYSPLGSNTSRNIDLRIIAASNRDLLALSREGKFREDLYYRLDVVHLQVPPLRARHADIRILAQHFLTELRNEIDKPVRGFHVDAIAALEHYSWPGNVRELRNAVERSLLTCRGDLITLTDLPGAIRTDKKLVVAPDAPSLAQGQDLDSWLEHIERQAILDALMQSSGIQVQAAKQLGISERSLWHRIKKLNIQVSRIVSAG